MYRVIALLTFVNILNYLDRYLLNALIPAVRGAYGFDLASAGILVSAFVPGYVIFSPIFGYLGDRFPRPRLMMIGVALWSVATILTGIVSDFWLLVVARVLVGVGEASFGTMAPGYIKDRLKDPVKVNSALSLFFAAIPIGSALGYVTGGLFGDQSWHFAFISAGVVGLLLSIPVMRIVEADHREVAPANPIQGLREILSIPIMRYMIGGYIFNSFALYGIGGFLTEYGTELGFSRESISLYFGLILVAAGGFGTFLGGRLASVIAKRTDPAEKGMLWFVGCSGIVAAPFVWLAFVTTDHNLFLLYCFLAEVFVFAGIAPLNSLIVLSCPPALVTLTQGLTILAINILGAMPSPIVIGFVADNYSLSVGMRLTAGALVLSGVIWLMGLRRLRIDHDRLNQTGEVE